MSAGGLMQLVAYGAQDIYLTDGSYFDDFEDVIRHITQKTFSIHFKKYATKIWTKKYIIDPKVTVISYMETNYGHDLCMHLMKFINIEIPEMYKKSWYDWNDLELLLEIEFNSEIDSKDIWKHILKNNLQYVIDYLNSIELECIAKEKREKFKQDVIMYYLNFPDNPGELEQYNKKIYEKYDKIYFDEE